MCFRLVQWGRKWFVPLEPHCKLRQKDTSRNSIWTRRCKDIFKSSSDNETSGCYWQDFEWSRKGEVHPWKATSRTWGHYLHKQCNVWCILMNYLQCAEVNCCLKVMCEVEEVFIGWFKWQMTRQKLRKVILSVEACRPKGRRLWLGGCRDSACIV